MSAALPELAGRKGRGLFNHPEDVHCALYNLVVLACYGVAFWLWLNPETCHLDGLPERIAFALGAGFLLGWISGVNVGVNFHNHAHRPIFRSAIVGRWFAHLWTFTGGWPAYYWYHAHVVVHHAHLLDEEHDWTLPRRRADGRFESVYAYVLCHWPWRYLPHLLRDFRLSRGGPWVRGRAVKDGLIFLALWSIPWWLDPWMGLALWLFPQWIANAVIMGSGMYVQHAQSAERLDLHLREGRGHFHSNTFLSRFFNLTMFNIGYHVEHHEYPDVHWSALPRFHAKMRARYQREGVHVVSYGYYHAAHIVASELGSDRAFERFTQDQAPGFEALTPAPGLADPSEAPAAASGAEVASLGVR